MNIFVTVGTQKKFTRLINCVDSIFVGGEHTVYCQVGIGGKSNQFEYTDVLSPQEYLNYFNNSDIIISHLGMGTILKGRKFGKKIILMPRDYTLGEHRNNHQLDIVPYVKNIKGVNIATTCNEISELIDIGVAAFSVVDDNKLNEINDNLKKHIDDYIK